MSCHPCQPCGIEHGWTVRSPPSMLTVGKHWREIGSLCLPGGKDMKCLIPHPPPLEGHFLFLKDTGRNRNSHKQNPIVHPPYTFCFAL